MIKKVDNTAPWTYVINDLNSEKTIGTFYEKELQKTNQQEFRIEKVIKKKCDKLYVKWKCYHSSFNSWIDKKDSIILLIIRIKMSQHFPKLYEPFGGDISVKIDLSNYVTKADIRNISHVDTSSLELKTNLASLRTEVDKLEIDKSKILPSKFTQFKK